MMKKSWRNVLFITVVLSFTLLLLVSCGGGEGGGDAVAPTTPSVNNSPVGHYVLKGFRVEWKGGGVVDTQNMDGNRFKGQMNIYDNNYMLQSVTIDGKTRMAEAWFVMSGSKRTLIASWGNDCRYNIDYWWDNPVLTLQVNYPCGEDFKERETWRKVSNTPTNSVNAMAGEVVMSMEEFEELEREGNTTGGSSIVGTFF